MQLDKSLEEWWWNTDRLNVELYSDLIMDQEGNSLDVQVELHSASGKWLKYKDRSHISKNSKENWDGMKMNIGTESKWTVGWHQNEHLDGT